MGQRAKAGRAGSTQSGVLTVCGLGIDRPHDATLGTIQALKDSDVVFYIHGDGESLKPFLATFCPDLRLGSDAKYEPLNGDRKLKAVAADVCAELKKGKNVAYATYGHPMMFSDAFHVVKACRAKGFECRVLTAPSAVDSILASAGESFETLSNSFLVCSSDEAVKRPVVLRTGFPVILLGLDAVVARGLYGSLCAAVEAGYRAEDPVYAVKCRDGAGEAVRLVGRVRDLRGWEKKIVHMMSLVLPASRVEA